MFEKTKPASGHQSLDSTKTFFCLSPGLGHCLLPGVGVQCPGASVRGARRARRPLLQVLQRPASLQRQVVQEWQGVLQVSFVKKCTLKDLEFVNHRWHFKLKIKWLLKVILINKSEFLRKKNLNTILLLEYIFHF